LILPLFQWELESKIVTRRKFLVGERQSALSIASKLLKQMHLLLAERDNDLRVLNIKISYQLVCMATIGLSFGIMAAISHVVQYL
jgi:hypothetical protein